MRGYNKDFNEIKHINFLIKDGELLEPHKIQERVNNLKKEKTNSES